MTLNKIGMVENPVRNGGSATKDLALGKNYSCTNNPHLDTYLADIGAGKGFGKTSIITREQGDVVLECPETLYSATALIYSLQISPWEKDGLEGWFVWFFAFFPLTAASILCVVAQAGAIYFVFKLNDETTTNFDKEGAKYCESDDTDYFLRLICLVTFVATCACDFKESFHYFQYILRVPMRNGSEQETDALNEVKTSLATKHVVVKHGEEYKLEVSAFGGFSRWEQLVALGWGLIKFAMEVGLVVAGSGYVLHADSNENLLLNSVALAFVSQIDDVAYNFAVTSAFKTWMRALPQFGLIFSVDDDLPLPYKAGKLLWITQFYGQWFQVFFLLGLSAMLWTVHC